MWPDVYIRIDTNLDAYIQNMMYIRILMYIYESWCIYTNLDIYITVLSCKFMVLLFCPFLTSIHWCKAGIASENLYKTHNKYDVLLSLFCYPGTAGDSFSYHRGASFSTKDRDNDVVPHQCAVTFKGGWWYTRCRDANLNGIYRNGSHETRADGINWFHWKGDYYSAMRTEMKIRPAEY